MNTETQAPATIAENTYMPAVREAWANRCKNHNLKLGTKSRDNEMTAYLQGVLAVATAAGIMTHNRAQMIAMLVMCGRGEEFLKQQK